MPMYEYQCKKCEHRFERIQKFSARTLKKCPECGGALEQLLTAAAVRFKGTGWYVTDYPRKGSDKAARESASGEAKEAAGERTEAKAESKAEAQTEAKTEGRTEGKTASEPKKPEKKKK